MLYDDINSDDRELPESLGEIEEALWRHVANSMYVLHDNPSFTRKKIKEIIEIAIGDAYMLGIAERI